VAVSAERSLLVDRDGDAAALDALLEDGRAGRGRALVLWGEPGIGKTALLEHAAGGAVEMQVLRVAGLESEAKLSFAALRQFLEPLLAEIADLPLDQHDALQRALGLPGGDSAEPYLVDLGVLALLVAAAEKKPVLCLVDDAQWLGQGSGEALAFAAHRLEGLRIVMLFVVDEPVGRGKLLEGLRLRQVVGLSDDGAEELLDAAVDLLESGVRARIVAEMAGNPLALLDGGGSPGRAGSGEPGQAATCTGRTSTGKAGVRGRRRPRQLCGPARDGALVYPHLHGVHGTFAIGPSHVLFAGMGGEIVDDPDAIRVEEAGLRYPAWEVEYRLKAIRELKDYQKVFLFTTQPAHKGLHGGGSEVLAELINTYRPRVAVVAGDGVAEARLGKTLVVCPGRLEHGQYALIDLHDLEVEPRTLAEHAPI
jgi:hypothetical protein